MEKYGGIYVLRKTLEQYNTSFSQVVKKYVENYTCNKLKDKLENDWNSKRKDTDEEKLRQCYDENKETMFTRRETVRAKRILILSRALDYNEPDKQSEAKRLARKKAEEILKRIRNGEDFDKLMNEYSQDPGLKYNPDGYTFARGEMIKEFEDAAFSLNVGEISGIIEAQPGAYIVKLEEKMPRVELTFDEVKDDIKTMLEADEKQNYFNRLVEEWWSQSIIENNLQ